MFGVHYSDTLLGRVFSQVTTPLGLALPLYTTTAICASGVCSMPLWNPPGSNRNVELISLDVDWASGTAATGGIFMMGLPVAQIGAAGPLTAMLQTTPVNGLLGAGSNTRIWSYNGVSAVTLTAAGTTLPPSSTAAGPVRVLAGINNETTGTPVSTSVSTYLFNGTVIVPQGYFIYFACTTATTALYANCLVWKEIPVVPSQG